ncbi:hypothetical protein BC629DRAFT_1451563 [Irpex lacteus]|nr:hypothetical protein BC629DRAFT_1451563 [Irpex lacteus]
MLDWLGRLLAPTERQPANETPAATRSSRSPSPCQSRSSRIEQPQSRTSRSPARYTPPPASLRRERSSPVRIKREYADPSLYFDTPQSSYSPDRNASSVSSASIYGLKQEETLIDFADSERSTPSIGSIVPNFVPESPTRGLMYDAKHGLHLMTAEEESNISRREFARLQKLKALRESIFLGESDEDEEEEEEEHVEERVPQRSQEAKSLPLRRHNSRTLKSKYHRRVATSTIAHSRPSTSTVSSRIKKPVAPASSSAKPQRAPTTDVFSCSSSSKPAPAVTLSCADSAQIDITPSHPTVTRVDAGPALISPPEPSRPAKPSLSDSMPKPEGKVTSQMQKVAEAKKRATMRISGPQPPTPHSVHDWLYYTGRGRLRSQLSKAEMEQKNLKNLKRLEDSINAVKARKAAEEEARKAAEAEAARKAEMERQWKQFASQSDWSGKLMERLEHEQEKAEHVHVYRESLLAEFWMYDERWKTLTKSAAEGEPLALLRLEDVPWPVLQSDAHNMAGPLDITADAVFFFIVHPMREGSCLPAYSVRHHLLTEEARRWRSEDFTKLALERVEEADRARVLEGAEHIRAQLRRIIEWEESLGEWEHDWLAKFPTL